MSSEKITLTLAENHPKFGRAGERVTLSLVPADVRLPEELPTFIQGYHNFGFRADEFSPIVQVDHDTDYIRTMSELDVFERTPVKTGIQGRVNEVDPRSSTTQFTVVRRAIGSFIPAVTERNATGRYKPRQAAGKLVKRKLDLDREYDVIQLLSTPTHWAVDMRKALGAGFNWNNTTGGSDPVRDLQEREEVSYQEITHRVMNLRTANVFLAHPSVREHTRQMRGDMALDAALTEINKQGGGAKRDFEIPGIGLICVWNSKAKDETTGKVQPMLADGTVIMLSIPPGETDEETICSSKTMRVKGDTGVGVNVREYWVDERGAEGGTMMVASMGDIALMTANTCGGIITGAYA